VSTKVKILAVDDSRTIREMIKLTLVNGGCEVCTAVDGIDGLSKIEEFRPDLVITDINMPNLDGFGVIEKIRSGKICSRVPILVLTTESGADLKGKAREMGATGWIVKPFEDKKLLDVISLVVTGFKNE